ncbi:MAG: hypothetical protein OQK82_07730 [Candidatus Pacearchaeota archaeon]|nr:hypothetical protein [Candidatus Pacearchaeota archaeon]
MIDKGADITGKKSGKREAPISYRPPVELKDEFYRRVDKSGLSTSAFITKSVFDQQPPRQSRRPTVEKKQLARLMINLAAIRDQLAKLQGKEGKNSNHEEIAQIMNELSEIRNAILYTSGRNP